MHVLILGAGALGTLLGARLARARVPVTLFGTNREHILAMQKDGVLVEELNGSVEKTSAAAVFDPSQVRGDVDLVLVTIKSYDTDRAVENIRPYCQTETIFLTLQNGIGNWERIASQVGREKVLLGSTAQGATLVAPGRIRHGGNGLSFVGEPEGRLSPRVEGVVDLFRQAGLETQPSDRMVQIVWEKLMVNVGINAITALTGIRNGLVANLEAGRELSRAAVEEALAVARAKGFAIDDEMVERVLTVARNTAANRSSMGQDVDRGKRTEIDAINGAIVQFGKELGLPTPVNRTLTLLIKIVEANTMS